jgi:type I restriction enzyme R subunit
MCFGSEKDFEKAVIENLSANGWEHEVLKNYTEEQLIDNWASILFKNNNSIDRLNNRPLTKGEMYQIISHVQSLKSPFNLNKFINGKTLTIKRDNPDDKLHFGKEVSLKIYDRTEIAAGKSRYQIVEQPKFPTYSKILNDRRGDLMLLINGMPVIHIELKRSGVPVSQATNQIEKYSHEKIFSGLFSLVQIFVAMTPEETVYFANPGPDGKFNQDFYFHWADFNNEPINDWKNVISELLSIPMAHQLIGFYTVADATDGILKVMRSYQYVAANAISDKVIQNHWEDKNQRGGYIWHTTGSGKTMTSFKSAQLIASSGKADKVVFLMDRIELGTQSFEQYKNFAGDAETVNYTETSSELLSLLESDYLSKTLIVSSIQKMSKIKEGNASLSIANALEKINEKRIVLILDECHRSTFGEMLQTIKDTFPNALFFGFTGTPIQKENEKKKNTTTDIFGDELHRYSIADAIRDKNVLGFDPYKVLTFKDSDLKKAVALKQVKANSELEVMNDPKKKEAYLNILKLNMVGHTDDSGEYIKGIEDFIPSSQYETIEHQKMVVQDIKENWLTLSQAGKFHAIFATSSIPEAINYYELIKKEIPNLKISALFDPNIDNNGNGIYKEEGLIKIISDYNERYETKFTIPTFAAMKRDLSDRLAHKNAYKHIENTSEKELDLLIVVDQMLTGFDSKWVNTLYMDKLLEYANLIQAFSRTNRLFGKDKPFGTIRYYRKPHTMERNVKLAVELYSGNKTLGLFAVRLNKNLEKMNSIYIDIKDLFENARVADFEKLPEDLADRKQFAELFKEFNDYLAAAKIQGFRWDKTIYVFNKSTPEENTIEILIDKVTYDTLLIRYKELFSDEPSEKGKVESVPYDVDGYLIAINTDKINADFLNSRFKKYIQSIEKSENIETAEKELHKSFAILPQKEQKFANVILNDIQR